MLDEHYTKSGVSLIDNNPPTIFPLDALVAHATRFVVSYLSTNSPSLYFLVELSAPLPFFPLVGVAMKISISIFAASITFATMAHSNIQLAPLPISRIDLTINGHRTITNTSFSL